MDAITKETRRESYYTVLTTLTERHKAVLTILKECGDMTAQDIATELYSRGITSTDERNFAAPRLTELADKGLGSGGGEENLLKDRTKGFDLVGYIGGYTR